MSRIHRLTSAASTGLAVAALAAGPASAMTQDLRSPGARDGIPTPGPAQQDKRSPDAREAAETRTPVVVRVAPQPDTGLSWDSAAIGALAASGLLISLAGGATLVSRRRTHPAI